MLRRFATCSIAVLLIGAVVFAKPKRSGKRNQPRPVSAARYLAMVKDWHFRKPGSAAPRDAEGRPLLVLEAINTRERIELAAAGDDGGFSALDLDRAAQLLRDTASGNELPIEPMLLDVLYRVQRHFDAPAVRVISGYRAGRGGGGGSRHAHGAAADIVIPGAKDADVAEYARSLGSTGVGLYPRSGYVHVDVRQGSYFWRDMSGPGQRSRPRRAGGRAGKSSANRPRTSPPVRASAIPGSDVSALLEPGKGSARPAVYTRAIDDHAELAEPASPNGEEPR
jgi:uncharacterized protein YcbK (DUF882 family)